MRTKVAGNEANDFACFGDPSRFEIAVAWLADADPVARRPAEHGWSMGKLQITIAGVNITESRVDGAQTGFVGWYLSPFFDWLATHWAALLHEDDFAWGERTAQPAAIACRRALDLNRGGESPAARATYKRIQSWFFRHGVRAASAGGLFPDLFIRRFEDDIELSWTPTPILCAPQDFAFASPVGAAYLAVSDVGGPLWDALQWAVAHTPVNMAPSFRDNWLNLCDKVAALNVADAATLDRTIDPTLFDRVLTSFKARGRQDLVVEQVANDNPWINVRSAAVAMYGGVNPQLQTSDVDRLRDILIDAAGGTDTERLAGLIEDRAGVPLDVPHRQGYEFALDLLDEMNLPAAGDDFIDVVALCAALGVTIRDETLDTDSIRGVALAGEGFRPVAVVNRRSFFNANEEGRRFSIAHELCHILHDRTRARRIAHVSGQWAPPGIEKRANAFAAYLLMPRELIEQHLGDLLAGSEENVTLVAGKMKVNESALVEHLYNLYMISEYDRECLRSVFSPSKH